MEIHSIQNCLTQIEENLILKNIFLPECLDCVN